MPIISATDYYTTTAGDLLQNESIPIIIIFTIHNLCTFIALGECGWPEKLMTFITKLLLSGSSSSGWGNLFEVEQMTGNRISI